MTKNINKHHIIIFDEDPELRNSIARVLLKQDFNVFQADDFEKTLEYIKTIQPKILLMGFEKPGRDQWTKIHQLLKHYSKTRIILITTFEKEELFKKIGAIPGLFVLTKPFKKDVLINTIHKISVQPA